MCKDSCNAGIDLDVVVLIWLSMTVLGWVQAGEYEGSAGFTIDILGSLIQ